MKLLLALLVAIICPVRAEPPPLNYTYFSTIQIDRSQMRQFNIYTDTINARLVIRSNNIQLLPIVYNLYSWQPLSNVSAYNFPFATQLIFFEKSNQSQAIYSTFMGEVLIRKYQNEQDYEDTVAYKQICPNMATELKVSNDGKRWARSCQTSEHILIGYVDPQQGQGVEFLQNEHNITSILWRPNSNQLLTVGYSNVPQRQMEIKIRNLDTNTTSLLYHSAIQLQLLFFSPSGLLYFRTIEFLMYSYNFSSSQLTFHSIEFSVVNIKLRGKFMVLDGVTDQSHHQWEYYYDFGVTNFTEENVYFKVQVRRQYFGSIPDANFLYALVRENDSIADLDIYQLCNQEGWFYNSDEDKCLPCAQSCLGCLYRHTSCLSCRQGSYLSAPTHSCIKCLQGCSLCQSNQKCLQCQESYQLDETTSICREKETYPWIIIVSVTVGIFILGLTIFKLIRNKRQKKKASRISILLKQENQSIDGESQLQE